ncbi:hypothetical protein [Hirschia baltica]|uniref:Uncharacterized protein n=1 Tax=Hirschia baltica (strain ATCC 49814 / DSM 5838 / IFAM 1418) TaxID=582402 RepID=C6XRE4_HIRBI|nr:hypothetical protein [Hirschia baltica]ACT58776.1 hypothetical protein Hbal_1082 [Hirschia baltica ATCC 49814]
MSGMKKVGPSSRPKRTRLGNNASRNQAFDVMPQHSPKRRPDKFDRWGQFSSDMRYED